MKTRVVSLVYYKHSEEEYVLPHDHNYYEMVFYKEGRGTVNVRKEAKKFDENSVFVIGPHTPHDEFSLSESTVYIVLFETDEHLDNIFTTLTGDQSQFVEQIFEKALEEYKNQEKYYNDYVNSLFTIILLETLRASGFANKKKNDNLYIKHAKKYIAENFVKDIDFELLARSSGYSYGRFRHIFKEGTGTTLKQYLLNIRLDHAKQYLAETDMAIKEVAARCGFKKDAQFVAFFSKEMKISPAKFRSVIRKENEIGVVNIKEETSGTHK